MHLDVAEIVSKNFYSNQLLKLLGNCDFGNFDFNIQ